MNQHYEKDEQCNLAILMANIIVTCDNCSGFVVFISQCQKPTQCCSTYTYTQQRAGNLRANEERKHFTTEILPAATKNLATLNNCFYREKNNQNDLSLETLKRSWHQIFRAWIKHDMLNCLHPAKNWQNLSAVRAKNFVMSQLNSTAVWQHWMVTK